jgi:hypothetical protein
VIYEVSARTGTNMDAALNAIASIAFEEEAIEYWLSSTLD